VRNWPRFLTQLTFDPQSFETEQLVGNVVYTIGCCEFVMFSSKLVQFSPTSLISSAWKSPLPENPADKFAVINSIA